MCICLYCLITIFTRSKTKKAYYQSWFALCKLTQSKSIYMHIFDYLVLLSFFFQHIYGMLYMFKKISVYYHTYLWEYCACIKLHTSLRFWLASCMEAAMRGAEPAMQMFFARRGLLKVKTRGRGGREGVSYSNELLFFVMPLIYSIIFHLNLLHFWVS